VWGVLFPDGGFFFFFFFWDKLIFIRMLTTIWDLNQSPR